MPPLHCPSKRSTDRFVWLVVGWACVGVGALGVVLPLLPTTPFLILAAAAFGRSSPRLRSWLLRHGTLGPIIEAWEQNGAIPRRAKLLAYAIMLTFLGLSALLNAPLYIIGLQAFCVAGAALFIGTRPDAETVGGTASQGKLSENQP
ncbi:MAG: YbaN family protein [Pseudomonadota bacterium]